MYFSKSTLVAALAAAPNIFVLVSLRAPLLSCPPNPIQAIREPRGRLRINLNHWHISTVPSTLRWELCDTLRWSIAETTYRSEPSSIDTAQVYSVSLWFGSLIFARLFIFVYTLASFCIISTADIPPIVHIKPCCISSLNWNQIPPVAFFNLYFIKSCQQWCASHDWYSSSLHY